MNRADAYESGLQIRLLEEGDVEPIGSALEEIGWKDRRPTLRRYLSDQDDERRTVLVALVGDVFAGYLTIDWSPTYPPFQQGGIPEITDFNVLPRFRRRGVGTRLMDEAERRISENSPVAGVAFGMDADYGGAQRMYVKRGYIPDGAGLRYKDSYVKYGDRVTVDDSLVLYLTKRLTA